MNLRAFLPRSESQIVFVLVMFCYIMTITLALRTLATAVGVPRPELGLFLEQASPTARVVVLLFLAPAVETLLLIGIIELVRWLRAPCWLQVAVSAVFLAIGHAEAANPWGFGVLPGFAIQSLAYLEWRRVSWKVGYAVVASIHVLLNLLPAISTVGRAVQNS